MSDAPAAPVQDDIQWYTAARKIPKYIGKPPGGGSYPGGPYTIPQFVGGALIFAIGAYTEGWWGGENWLVNKALLIAVTAAYVVAAKVIKPGGRAPWLAVPAYLSATVATPHGRYRGQRVHAPRASRARHGKIHVCLDGLPMTETSPAVEAASIVDAEEASAAALKATAPHRNPQTTGAAYAPRPLQEVSNA